MHNLQTERLILRPPEADDAADIALALNDFEVSKNLALVPHPYTEADARDYIARAAADWASGQTCRFAIRRKTDNALIGCCGLHRKDDGYEIGYWIAKPHWRQGYANEAARRVVEFGFTDLKAERLTAGWYHDNGISGRILAGLGFRAIGVEKRHCVARGYDVLCNRCLLTRADFGRPFEAPREPSAEGPGASLEPAA